MTHSGQISIKFDNNFSGNAKSYANAIVTLLNDCNASYQAKNKDIGNGNTLAGNYNLNVNGKSVEGYQTLDNVDWLKANYGNSYGKSINSDAASSTCQTSATANAAAQEAKETVKTATKSASKTETGHRTLSEFKDLNTKKEEISKKSI